MASACIMCTNFRDQKVKVIHFKVQSLTSLINNCDCFVNNHEFD